jgi:hypothetical protein
MIDTIRTGSVRVIGWPSSRRSVEASLCAWSDARARNRYPPAGSALSSIRASSRLPSFCVERACQVPEPAALISIAPSASPETLSVTWTATSVGSVADAASKPSCGGSGS